MHMYHVYGYPFVHWYLTRVSLLPPLVFRPLSFPGVKASQPGAPHRTVGCRQPVDEPQDALALGRRGWCRAIVVAALDVRGRRATQSPGCRKEEEAGISVQL